MSKRTPQSGILDSIAPVALEFRPQDLQLGELMARALVVSDYSPTVGVAWLAKLARIPGVYLSMHMSPADPTDLTKALNRNISELLARLNSGGTAVAQQRTEQALHNAEELLRKLDQDNQQVFATHVVMLVIARDRDELEKRTRQVKSIVSASQLRLREAMFAQEDGLTAAGPWGVLPEDIAGMTVRHLPAETAAAAFPFDSADLNAGSGVIVGKNKSTGGIVLWDRWQLPNPNMAILATSGAGKSYAATLLLLRELLLGAQVVVIDPEREYRRIAKVLGGQWVNCAGGSGVINPMEIRPEPQGGYADSDEEDEETAESDGRHRGPLARHLSRLKVFLRLYLRDISPTETAYLEDALIEVYAARDITWETDPTSVETWPTIADLHAYVRAKAETNPKLERLTALLRPAAEGSDSALWAGQSTVKVGESDFVVLDVHELTDSDAMAAQYYNVLGYAWDVIRQDRKQRKILLVDEAWLMIDPQVPQAIGMLKALAKRIRKYNGSLCVVSQNVIDFLAPEVARQGEVILGNAASKLLLRQGERDLEAIAKLMGLSEAEQELLERAKRGEGLLIAGNQRCHVSILASPEEHALIVGEVQNE